MSTSDSISCSSQPDINSIIELTKNCEFFKKLIEEQQSNEIHSLCCSVMEIQDYYKNELIIKYGDKGNNFYIILKGEVGIYLPKTQKTILTIQKVPNKTHSNKRVSIYKFTKEEPSPFLRSNSIFITSSIDNNKFELVKKMGQGEGFGELALMNEKPRAASVMALENTTLAVLSKKNFKDLIEKFSEKRMNEKLSFMKEHPIFMKSSKSVLVKLSFYFSVKRAMKGNMLFRAGDAVDGLYFIRKGDFMISKRVEINPPIINKTLKRFLKERLVKKINLISKSVNEIIGLQDFMEEQKVRSTSCVCSQNDSEVYFISTGDVKSRITMSDSWAWLNMRYSQEKELYEQRLREVYFVEQSKISFNYRSSSDLRSAKIRKDEIEAKKTGKLISDLIRHRRAASQLILRLSS